MENTDLKNYALRMSLAFINKKPQIAIANYVMGLNLSMGDPMRVRRWVHVANNIVRAYTHYSNFAEWFRHQGDVPAHDFEDLAMKLDVCVSVGDREAAWEVYQTGGIVASTCGRFSEEDWRRFADQSVKNCGRGDKFIVWVMKGANK